MAIQQHLMSVGTADCDINGFTNQHIQAAVDRIAYLGGGTVELSAGCFACADAVHLRSGVTLRGQGAATVLRKNPMKQSSLSGYIAYAHEDLIVAEPELFAIGDGFIVSDDDSWGFHDTQGTIIGKQDDYLIASTKHQADYRHTKNGLVQTLYPLISVINEHNVLVESIHLEGNSAENALLNGCRGSAFYAQFANDVHVCDLHVRDFNGEGIGFQTCERMHVEQSSVRDCMGNGFHPGSGSTDFYMHDCQAFANQRAGFFYCVRVRDGLLEDCEFAENKDGGVSIGARDVRSINRRLHCHDNHGPGIYFRGGDHSVAAHDTVIEACVLADNAGAQIAVCGAVDGVEIVGNQLRGACGIEIAAEVCSIEMADNDNGCVTVLVDQRV